MRTQYMRVRSRARRSREGAVMVEAVLVFSSFVLMLSLMITVHHIGVVRMHMFQQAQASGRAEALAGCPSKGLSMSTLLNGVGAGDVPDTGVTDDPRSKFTSAQAVEGIAGRVLNIQYAVDIPCQANPPAVDGDPFSLASQMFGE